MQKIVIDTNVLISALLSDGYTFKIINELVLGKKVNICLSDAIFEEYLRVISREKFAKYLDFKIKAEIVISGLESIALNYKPDIKIEVSKDASDNKFIELGIFSDADYLITGNIIDFPIGQYGKLKIITPKEFYYIINP